jgi:hypothetical protein
MLLKLTYTRASDMHQTVTVIGDPYGIRDLHWQLTHNYCAVDGAKIGQIKVTNLDGTPVHDSFWQNPHANATMLNTLEI